MSGRPTSRFPTPATVWRAWQAWRDLERFLLEQTDDGDGARRVTFQRAIVGSGREILARFELGPHGHGKCIVWARADDCAGAALFLLEETAAEFERWEREGRPAD